MEPTLQARAHARRALQILRHNVLIWGLRNDQREIAILPN